MTPQEIRESRHMSLFLVEQELNHKYGHIAKIDKSTLRRFEQGEYKIRKMSKKKIDILQKYYGDTIKEWTKG